MGNTVSEAATIRYIAIKAVKMLRVTFFFVMRQTRAVIAAMMKKMTSSAGAPSSILPEGILIVNLSKFVDLKYDLIVFIR